MRHVDLPQTYLEPILLETAAKRGAAVSFNTELVGFEQDADGVTSQLRDRLSGRTYECRSRYSSAPTAAAASSPTPWAWRWRVRWARPGR